MTNPPGGQPDEPAGGRTGPDDPYGPYDGPPEQQPPAGWGGVSPGPPRWPEPGWDEQGRGPSGPRQPARRPGRQRWRRAGRQQRGRQPGRQQRGRQPDPQRPGRQLRPDGDPLVAADFESWFGRIFGVARRSFLPLLALSAVPLIPIAFSQHYLHRLNARIQAATNSDGTIGKLPHIADLLTPIGVWLAIAFLLGLVIAPASIWVAVRQAGRGKASLIPALAFGVRRALPLFGWQLLAGILVVVGVVLLVLPGVYLAVAILPILTPVVAIERGNIRRCLTLISGRWWATAGRILVMALLLLGYATLVQLIIKAVFGSADAASTGAVVLSTLLNVPASVVGVGFYLATYAELRGRKESVSTAQLVAELDR